MSHFWHFGPYLDQVRNSEPFWSHWKWAYFLQGPRQQSNVEECAWWIQEGARPSQLIAPLKLFKKSGKKYLWFAGNIISTISYPQRMHCWSRDLAAAVTWPTVCSQNNQTPTFQSKENATTMADQRILCYFGSKVPTPATASILHCFCALCQEVEGEECPCVYFQVWPPSPNNLIF